MNKIIIRNHKMPKCNQCDSVTINGVYCHERGCPNINKSWNIELELWVDSDPEDYNEDYLFFPEDFEEES